METPIYTETIRNFIIKIFNDTDAQNPVGDWDMATTFGLINHRNYKVVNNDHGYTDLMELKEYLESLGNDVIYLPVRLYDHSGLTCSVSGGYPYNDQWDSGMWGYVWITKETAKKEWSNKKWNSKKTQEFIIQHIKNDVQVLDDYLTGNVFGFVVENAEGENVDSCWGFFADHSKNEEYYRDCLEEARSMAQWNIKEENRIIAEKRGKTLNNMQDMIHPSFATV